MARTGQLIGLAEVLCEHYLPRVFRYVRYWVEDVETAEEISLKVLKDSIRKAEGACDHPDSLAVEVFSLAQKAVKRHAGLKGERLAGLSPAEREVMTLKLGGELPNLGIALILGLPEAKVGEIVYRSLCKLNRTART